MRTEREWERIITPPIIEVGGQWNWFDASGRAAIEIRQIDQYQQRWFVTELNPLLRNWVQRQWDREWPVPPDFLRVAVHRAVEDAEGRDFVLQRGIAEIDLHGGEQ